MELWNHCENPYPFVPNEVLEQAESVRASLPNEYCDPKIVAQLYDEILDEYRLCDDGSEFGTRVFRDGRSIECPSGNRRGEKLRSGDEIYLGRACLRFEQ